MNISMLLQMAAETCPDRRGLTTSDHTHYTYAQLYNAAQVAADLIRESKCQYVSVMDISSPAVPIALMGAAMAGVSYVPLNYRLAREQLDELLERITPAYIIADDANYDHYQGLDSATFLRREYFIEKAISGTPSGEAPPDDPSMIAVQLFTSGTTGKPKAAILRHEHLVSYILSTVEFMGAAEEDAQLVSVPPYHIAGISAVMSSVYSCRRIVQLPDFRPAQWLYLCDKEQVTNAFVVPTMLSRVVDHLETIDEEHPKLEKLRAVSYGGGKMPLQVIEKVMKLFPHVDFTNAYGLTETSSTIALLDPNDHREAFGSDDPKIRARLGSVGKPLPTVEFEIRDEDGKALGPNQPGEIYVRGSQVSGEYLERNALDNDGWFPTRDAGYMDEGGYLFLSGRADDVIVRGGENFSPGEVEDVLLTHEAVADAGVVAIPSQEWGETAGAVIVLKPGKEASVKELQQLVKDELRSSRVPEKILFEKELPYNETGKLLRRVLKDLFD